MFRDAGFRFQFPAVVFDGERKRVKKDTFHSIRYGKSIIYPASIWDATGYNLWVGMIYGTTGRSFKGSPTSYEPNDI